MFGALAALLVAYLLLPIIGLAGAAGGSGSGGPPASEVLAALGTSALTATLATALMLLLGVPFAYLLARGRGIGAAVLGALVLLPLAVPPLVGGLLLIQLFGPYGPIGLLAARLGWQTWDSPLAIVLAQLFVATPFLIVTARTALAGVDPAFEDVAATLGAGPWDRFRLVALPLAGAGIAAGALLAWVRAFGEFGATMVMAYHPYSLPVLTWVALSGTGVPAALPLAAIAIAVAASIALILGLAPLARSSVRAEPMPPGTEGDGLSGQLAAPAAASLRTNGTCASALQVAFQAHLGAFQLDVAFESHGGLVALFGPSGAGKSATLRGLAGLLTPDSGSIRLDRATWFDAGHVDLPAHRRRVGYVLQTPALLPHLDVEGNVTFGVRSLPPAQRKAAVWAALQAVGMQTFADRRPHQLSGGQQQRVALARVLARRPRLLLFDEPFSALDAPVRQELRQLVRTVQRETGIPAVFVTHDLAEAAELSDALVLLQHGKVVQQGPTAGVLRRPASVEAARLLGFQNVLAGRVVGHRMYLTDGLRDPVGLAFGSADSSPQHGPTVAVIRAEHVVLEGADRLGPNRLSAEVESSVLLGGMARVSARVIGGSPAARVQALVACSAERTIPTAGALCTLYLPPDDLLVLPTSSNGPTRRTSTVDAMVGGRRPSS